MALTRTLTGLAFIVSVLSPPGTAWPFEAELERYQQGLTQICHTGVTPELIRLHKEVVKAVDAATYGGGRQSNFWGPRPPDLAYQDCFQSPGWGQ